MVEETILCDLCGVVNSSNTLFCTSCGQALSASMNSPNHLLEPGVLLKQRYRVRKEVGRGGFGAVYQAEDTLFNRPVAIKEMRPRGLSGKELQQAVEAFQSESMLLAHLKYPSLPATHDYFSEAGSWYLVMEFLEGETLEARLARIPGGRLPVAEALRIGLQLCSVLDYLHTHQPPIIFRDLKPSNIMCGIHDEIFLIDFGIARHFKPGQAKDTIAFGSPGYAAPEQYGKAQTTPQADLYSLGATLHHLLSGRDPRQSPFVFPPLQLPNPKGLESLILQMVEYDASKRPVSASAVARQLQRIAADYASTHRLASSDGPGPQAQQSRVKNQETTPQTVKGTGITLLEVACPLCANQHTYQLRRGYTNLLCEQTRHPFTVLVAKVKAVDGQAAPDSTGIWNYQARVLLPAGEEETIELQSRTHPFSAKAGDLLVIAYLQGRAVTITNATAHRSMLAVD